KQFFSKLKDKIPDGEKKNLIYKIDCECERCYIGQTSRQLKQRISEHEGGCRKLNRIINADIINETDFREIISKTALLEHAAEFDHVFDFKNVKILDQTSNTSQLNVLEMLHIINNKTVNRRTDTINLCHIYNGILHLREDWRRKRKN
ncbi:CLUMA_CG012062, isoform A, partial [Clunio marinus]